MTPLGSFGGLPSGRNDGSVGDDADKYGDDHHFRNHEEAATWLSNETSPGDIVLFKGSRMAAMDQVMKLTFPE